MQGCILIIDFGSQYTQLIARRIRELKVYSVIYPFDKINQKLLKEIKPSGIILSGGPKSVLDKDSPLLSSKILNLNKPILGICYGLQVISKHLGGKINKSLNREYGFAKINIIAHSKILPTKWINKNEFVCCHNSRCFDIVNNMKTRTNMARK